MDRPIGSAALLLAEGDPWAPWFEEALLRLGLSFCRFAPGQLGQLGPNTVLILAGAGVVDEGERHLAKAHLSRGGALIAAGSTWGLEELLGIRSVDQPGYSRSQLKLLPSGAGLSSRPETAFTFFSGPRVELDGADALAVDASGAPLIARKGAGFLFVPHVGRTLGRMAMGTAVACDSIGPDDGSAVMDDGVARAEDGISLRWDADRCRTEGVRHPYFGVPHADGIVEVFCRVILMAMDAGRLAPVLAWPWPKGAAGLAAVSLDVDDTRPEAIQRAMHALMKFGIKAAWMTPPPGLPQDTVRSLRRADQSIGLLFSGRGAAFEGDQVKAECVLISRLSGLSSLACGRPIDGRWQGWDRFYRFLDAAGCRASLSKGGRQPGTTGFAFGTTHPFQTRAGDGSLLRTLELPHSLFFPASPDGAAANLSAWTAHIGGCLHAAFLLSTAMDGRFERSLQNLHMLVRQNRLVIASPEQAAALSLARRAMRLTVEAGGLVIASEAAYPGLTLLAPPGSQARSKSAVADGQVVQRHGRRFQQLFVDVEARSTTHIGLSASQLAA